MHNRRQLLGLLGGLLVTTLVPGAAHALGTTLEVTVVNKRGKKVAGATVRVYMGKGGEGDPLTFIGEGKTNKDGVLRFVVLDDVEGQTFLISASDGEFKNTKKTKAKSGKTKARIKLAWPV